MAIAPRVGGTGRSVRPTVPQGAAASLTSLRTAPWAGSGVRTHFTEFYLKKTTARPDTFRIDAGRLRTRLTSCRASPWMWCAYTSSRLRTRTPVQSERPRGRGAEVASAPPVVSLPRGVVGYARKNGQNNSNRGQDGCRRQFQACTHRAGSACDEPSERTYSRRESSNCAGSICGPNTGRDAARVNKRFNRTRGVIS